MEYLLIYYDHPEGPEGREPAEEYRMTLNCVDDDEAKKESARFPTTGARLYRAVPLK